MSRGGWIIAWLLACGLAGCPKGNGSAGTSSTGDPCDEWKAWKLRCTPDAGPEDLEWYDECHMLHWDNVKPEFTRAITNCFPTLSCDTSDDRCSAMGYEALGVTEDNATQDALVRECLDAITDCDLSDDMCFELTALVSSARSEVEACSGLSCDAYRTCLREVFGAGPDKDTP